MNEFDFKIGSSVECKDGSCGKLARVVVDPETLAVTHLIVEAGLLLKKARVFPINIVERADEAGVQLSISSEALSDYPEYQEVDVEQTVPGSAGGGVVSTGYGPVVTGAPTIVVHEKRRLGIAEELETVKRGTPVSNAHGQVGKLEHVVADPDSGAITHLVIRQGLLFSHDTTIPLALVEQVTEEGIFIAATDEELKTLPPFGGSATTQAAQIGSIDTTDTGSESVAVRIETALVSAPQTQDARIEVIHDRGIVTLLGEVESEATRVAAGAIAAEQRGVTRVNNELKVTPR